MVGTGHLEDRKGDPGGDGDAVADQGVTDPRGLRFGW
jgi:hypothetical protein